MMSIFLTEDLEQKVLSMENTCLVYYFFSFQDENRNTGITLLQSLIHQIVTKRPELKTHLLPYIRPGNSQQPQLSLEPLWAIFKKLIQDPKLGTILCVIDGLDESDKDASQILLPRLIDLVSSTSLSPLSTTFKLIVVSRDISGLEDYTRIKLDPDNNKSVHGDIEKFISIRVCDLLKIVGSRHECEREVQATLLERAEGTFLWVGFATHELTQKRTWTEVFDALKNLPSGLPAIYSRMLHQIPAERRQTSSRILQWVTMAFRSLTLLEIAIAIGLKSPSSSISLEHAMMDEIILCGSFLEVQYSEVTLIHQSVRDYLLDERQQNTPVLEAFRIKPNEAHFEMAQTCLECVQQSSLQQKPLGPIVRPGESPLLRYAAQHWLEHAASCSDLTAGLFDSTQSFFTHNRGLRDRWWEFYGERSTWEWMYHGEPPPLLHIACRLEIVSWVMIMVHENSPTGSKSSKILLSSIVNQKDVAGNTALHHAAFTGNSFLVQLLFQSGANVSANNRGRTALHFAAESGKESTEIVQLLLEQGADIHAPDSNGRTALHEAIREGNLQIFRILLDRGASLQSADFEGSTALHIAAASKDVNIVQILLDRGANLEAVDHDTSTALHKAIRSRDVDTVRLLLDRGANLETVGLFGLTALQNAAERRDVNTVQLLLDRGASLEAVGFFGSTALHIATRSTDVDTIQLLLDKGADIQAKDEKGKTVLHWAASTIYSKYSESMVLETIQLLLDRGADVQARNSEGETALHMVTRSLV
jgi:ankyrin repeat protein